MHKYIARRIMTTGLAAATAIVLTVSAAPAAGDPRPFAAVDVPGPALSVPDDQLAASITCTPAAHSAERNVVLFVPGTGLTPEENYRLGWFRSLDQLGWPYCSVADPDHALGDAQIAAEYVANAIRYVHQISGRAVNIVGHSQGGTQPRFAMRFWPDLRPLVDDYVGIAATNHGSLIVDLTCNATLGCPPAAWQQGTDSRYTRAMNSGQETFAGISYTNVYTRTDPIVQPNLNVNGSSSLRTGGGAISNIGVQDLCSLRLSEHFGVGVFDATTFAIAMDAFTHPGPADPARIRHDVCSRLFMPGVDVSTLPREVASVIASVTARLAQHPRVNAEPELRPYVFEH
ncbi:lipase family alpha/beta hydrolase [Nocardia sp. NPDC055029]